jgi:phosphoserine phosphatase
MSASVDCYVPRIGTALGFAETICTAVRWRSDQRLDGRLASVNVRGAEKLRRLRELQAQLQPAETIAYGNSTADLPHMQIATRGYFINGRVGDLPDRNGNIQQLRWV